MYVKRAKLHVLALLMAILLCSISPVSALVVSNDISVQRESTEKVEALVGPTQISTESLEEVTQTTEEEFQTEPKIDGPVPANGTMPLAAGNYIWFQGYVYRVNEDAPNYKRTYTLKDGTHAIDLDHLYVMRLKVNGSWKVAYCLEPDTATRAGVDYGDGSNTGVSGDWKVHLTQDQQTAIGLAMLYSGQHHPDTLSSTESVEWEVATQIILWEIVMGMRGATSPYACTDSSLIAQFDSAQGVRYNDGSNYYLKGIRAKYNTLSAEMAVHRVIPSFTAGQASAAPVHTMQRQANGSYSLTLTDTNGVLGNYKFSSQSPLTLSQSGNTLTATAPSGASWSEMTFRASRSMPNPENPACLFRIFYLDDHNQALASPPDKASIPSDPVPAYFKVKEGVTPGTASMRKTSDSGPVEGYCFKMWQANGNRTYYGKSDSDGNIYVTNSSYAATGTRSYTFSGLLDGEFSFREVLSASDHQSSHPVSWRFVVTDRNGKVTVDRTLQESDITADGGDFITPRIQLTGLTGGGKLTMTVENAPNTGTLEIRKTSDDGKISGITFTLEEWVPGIGYCSIGKYTTDSQGCIQIPDVKIGTTLRVTEMVPEGYVSENPVQTITIQSGTNTVTFQNRPIFGNLELSKVDESDPTVKLSGAEFTVTKPNGAKVPMKEVLDQAGKGTGVYRLEGLPYGRYTVQETKAPEGYELNQAIFEVHITEEKTYVIQADGFEGVPNQQLIGSLTVHKVDLENRPLSGVTFLLEYSMDGESWNPVVFREEHSTITPGGCTSQGLKEGALTTGEDGMAVFSGLAITIGQRHIQYRLTETATLEGYTLLAEPVFTGELPDEGTRDVTITAVNTGAFTMPFTGSVGFPMVTLGTVLVLLTLCAMVFLSRKRKKGI